jgi:hypothetical protein
MGKPKRKVPRLIECEDGSLAPSALTCVHICDGTADEAVAVEREDGGEITHDWICSACYEKHFLSPSCIEAKLEDLRIVCLHCLREITKPYRNVGKR